MQPFDEHPGGGRELMGPPRDTGNCRHGQGLELQQRTRQTACAYCGESLVDEFRHWLEMAVDHVVPASEARRLGIPVELYGDLCNTVLACAGCNGLDNRHEVKVQPQQSWTLDEFLVLRDAVFARRKEAIAARRVHEMAFYAGAPWLQPYTSKPRRNRRAALR